MTLRILLVDDHEIVRQGLVRLIEEESGWTVCGQAGDGLEAIELCASLEPDVVVMDLSLPRLNGHEATLQIVARHPRVKIVALSAHTDPGLVGRMLRAGAKAFVPKGSAYGELVTAMKAVTAGKTWLSPSVAGYVVDEFIVADKDRDVRGIDTLTPTERLVLQHIASGLSSKEIAAEMHVSPRTVDTHRRKILRKLGASGVADLTRIAILHGLVQLT